MTMFSDALPPTLFPAASSHLRAAASAIGRLCHAFAVSLMRRQISRALHSLSDRLLTEAGIGRHEIDAFVAEQIAATRTRR